MRRAFITAASLKINHRGFFLTCEPRVTKRWFIEISSIIQVNLRESRAWRGREGTRSIIESIKYYGAPEPHRHSSSGETTFVRTRSLLRRQASGSAGFGVTCQTQTGRVTFGSGTAVEALPLERYARWWLVNAVW